MNYQNVIEEFDQMSAQEQELFEQEIHNRRIAHRRRELAQESVKVMEQVNSGKFSQGTANDFFRAVDNATDLD